MLQMHHEIGNMLESPDFTEVTTTADIRKQRHGNRAKCLQRLVRLGLPVPQTVALSFETVRNIANWQMPDLTSLLGVFEADTLLISVRS